MQASQLDLQIEIPPSPQLGPNADLQSDLKSALQLDLLGNLNDKRNQPRETKRETKREVTKGERHKLVGLDNPAERNFQIAHQLAATLRGRGQYRRTYQALSTDQKKQFGQSICNHLKASLRQQSEAADRQDHKSTSATRAA